MNPLEQAKSNIRSTLGISEDPTTWTYEQRNSYIRALSQFIQLNPSSATASQLQTAQRITRTNYQPLDDTSLLSEIEEFGGAFTDNVAAAGEKVGGIGEGFLNLASLSKWLIPLVGVALLFIFLRSQWKKA